MRTLVVAVLAILVGCASAPRNTDTVASNAATPATATSESTASKSAAAGDERREFKPPPGFKVKIAGWDVVYCRKMPVLGSRFPKEICMTEAQLKEHMAANDAMRRDKDQASRVCTGGACNP